MPKNCAMELSTCWPAELVLTHASKPIDHAIRQISGEGATFCSTSARWERAKRGACPFTGRPCVVSTAVCLNMYVFATASRKESVMTDCSRRLLFRAEIAGRPNRSVSMASHFAKRALAKERSGSRNATSPAAIQHIPMRVVNVLKACSFWTTRGVASRRRKSASLTFFAAVSGRTTSKTALSASAKRESSGSKADPHSTSETPWLLQKT
eukprot:7382976-Prymnesium_polylepis.3